MQARAREDLVIRTVQIWNLHDTIIERMERCTAWVTDNSDNQDSQTRGLVALMNHKHARLRRLMLEWQTRFGHMQRGEAMNYDAVIDALDEEQAHDHDEEEAELEDAEEG